MNTIRVIHAVPKNTNSIRALNELQETVESENFEVILFDQANITKQHPSCVLSDFQSSSAIIADLSGGRPSCYYELALAELSEKPLLVCALKGTKIFQTSKKTKVNEYETEEDLSELVRLFLQGL